MDIVSEVLKTKEVEEVRQTQRNGEGGVSISFYRTALVLFLCLEENGDGLQIILFDGPKDIYRKFIPTR